MVKRIFLAYEPEHAVRVKRYVDGAVGAETVVVALDAEVEYELQRLGVPFESARTLRSADQFERLALAEEWARGVFTTPPWEFLTYRTIKFGSLFLFQVQVYFQRVAYSADMIAALLKGHPTCTEIISGAPPLSWNASSAIDTKLGSVITDCARVICAARGISFVVLPQEDSLRARASLSYVVFEAQRFVFCAAMSAWNSMVRLRTRKRVRILASEHWRNISGLMRVLPESELILLDRA